MIVLCVIFVSLWYRSMVNCLLMSVES
jgi:hypothetical protein